MPTAVGMHLGAEYNGNHRLAGAPMNDLMADYLSGRVAESPYFRMLAAQVRCFGDPERFLYDDVSRVQAGGTHTAPANYKTNVSRSVPHHVAVIANVDPRLILVGGGDAFNAFIAQILPAISGWRGDLVLLRNASAEGHRVPSGGSTWQWLRRYREFTSDLLLTARPPAVRRWQLSARDVDTAFRLVPL